MEVEDLLWRLYSEIAYMLTELCLCFSEWSCGTENIRRIMREWDGLKKITYVWGWYSVWEDLEITSMPISLHMVMMFWSRTRPNGSGSSSNVRHVVPHSLNSLGRTPAGCPRTTNNRELSFLKLWSKSSKDSRRNLNVRNNDIDENILRDLQDRQQLTSICWCLHWKIQQTKDQE